MSYVCQCLGPLYASPSRSVSCSSTISRPSSSLVTSERSWKVIPGIAGPAVAGAEQLPGEDPAGRQRAAYLLPHVRKLGRRTERQTEPGMDQVRGRQGDIGEGGAH
jgi:hypothetical protein